MNIIQCTHCGRSLNERELFCTHCGTTTSSSMIECENHPGERAIGVCPVCAKPVCGDCAISVQQFVYCDHPEHQTLHGEWSLILSSNSEFEADAVVRNLSSDRIVAQTFSMRDHVSAFWFDECAIVRVMVRRKDHERALTALRQLQLIEDASTS